MGAHDSISCDCCMRMNAKKAPFQKMAEERSTVPGERIHSDVKELSTRSIEGHLYAVCFVDDATRRCVTYPIKRKDEVIKKLEHFLTFECAARGRAVRYLRSDHGGEYDSEEMSLFCSTRGIWQEFSPPHCPSANGVAEVAWRDTFKMVRTILHDQQRPAKYWAIALRFATYLRNHLMTNAVLEKPPEAAWTGKKVDLAHLRVPLSTCWAYIEKKNRTDTLGPRRTKGIFVGYATHSPAYLVLSLENNRVYERRYADVMFDESCKAQEGETLASEDAAQLRAFLDELDQLTLVPSSVNTEEQLQAAPRDSDGTEQPAEQPDSTSPASPPDTPPQPQPEPHPPPQEPPPTHPQQPSSTLPSPPEPVAPEEEDADDGGDEDESKRRWYRTKKDMTVQQVASLLNENMHKYLRRLRTYQGWYQKLTSPTSVIAAGSDVPVPATSVVPVERERRQRNKKRKAFFAIEGVHVEVSRAVHRSLRDQHKIDNAHTAMRAHELDLHDLWHHFAGAVLALPDPKSVKQALGRPDADKWKFAMRKEWKGLWDKEAFEQVPRTSQKLHNMLWVFKRKSDGTYKARLCFDGRRQDPSTYENIASPTMKLTSLRILLALAAQRDWPVYADDATQAFLNAERPTDKPLYASYPEGFRQKGGRHCLLVKRMLYGLHDAPMGWFQEIRQHLTEEQGFKQSKADSCLFYKPGCYVVCHVDDFASTGDPATVQEFRRNLHAKFKMTGGRISEYYGLEVNQDLRRSEISLSCRKYLEKALVKLGVQAKAWNSPMEAHFELPTRPKESPPDPALQRRYRQLVGTVMHPSVTCRPDVSAAVRALSVHLQNPAQEHVKAAERVLQYLHHTRHLALTWRKLDSFTSSFYGTCDAAHNVTSDSKGITGWSYHLGLGAVSWKCRAQSITALSSTEAELIAVDDAAREAQFLHKLLDDFGLHVSDHLPTIVHQDNQSTIKLIHSDSWNPRTKHVALRYHHTGDLVKNGVLKIKYLSTDQMTADVLTKPLPSAAHHQHRSVLMGHTPLPIAAQRQHQQ